MLSPQGRETGRGRSSRHRPREALPLLEQSGDLTDGGCPDGAVLPRF